MKSKTKIVGVICPESTDAAIRDARNAYAAGAQAVMADLRYWPEAERTVADFRRAIVTAGGEWMFCLYRSDIGRGNDDARRMEVLLRCAEAGAAYVDVMADLHDPRPSQISYADAAIREQKKAIGLLHGFGAKAIMSTHDLLTVLPEDELVATLRSQEARGADVVKIVSRYETENDIETARRVFRRLNAETGVPWICLGTGPLGHAQRFLGAESGCAMEFARTETATDGMQPTIAEFLAR